MDSIIRSFGEKLIEKKNQVSKYQGIVLFLKIDVAVFLVWKYERVQIMSPNQINHSRRMNKTHKVSLDLSQLVLVQLPIDIAAILNFRGKPSE